MIGAQAWAIVWAQWRSLVNYHLRSRGRRFPITAIFGFLWYGLWALFAVNLAIALRDPGSLAMFEQVMAPGLLIMFVYGQIVPIIMVSTGVSLDLTRILVYPVRHVQLFTIEVLLRVTTCFEMMLLCVGLCVGILLNPRLPAWGVIAIVVFAWFNLFVAAGLKDLLGRLLVRKGFREALVFLFVLLTALPQLLLLTGASKTAKGWLEILAGRTSPWGATAVLALGKPDAAAAAVLVLWTAIAWYFGRSQFERTLKFDVAEASAAAKSTGRRRELLDVALRFVTRIFPDPLAALVEKEIRFLSRSPRFRLLFFMGFSFGLLIWLPMAARHNPDSFFGANYLTIVSAYALMLLGEVCFWNCFGLDRSAVQAYFTMPVPLATVFRAKNIAAVFFILLELSMVSLLCLLLRMPVNLTRIGEAFGVTLVFATFLLAFGNTLSVRYPKPINPGQSWRSGAVARAQAFLMFLYPLAAAPIALAYGAKFAFESQLAFYGVLLLDFFIGLTVYSIALESAVQVAENTKESIVLALTQAEGPTGT